MEHVELISAEEFCVHHHVEYSLINTLQQFGLVEVTAVEEHLYIPENQLPRLEQMLRLHNDLDINLEGIDAIINLLDRMKQMQSEIAWLRNRLRLYKD